MNFRLHEQTPKPFATDPMMYGHEHDIELLRHFKTVMLEYIPRSIEVDKVVAEIAVAKRCSGAGGTHELL